MNAFRCFLGSTYGLLATLLIAGVGVYLFWNHSGHVLAAAPYLLFLLCPLMHVFGHRHGHDHSRHSDTKESTHG